MQKIKEKLEKLKGKEVFLIYFSQKRLHDGWKKCLEDEMQKKENEPTSGMGGIYEVIRRDSEKIYPGFFGVVLKACLEDGRELEEKEISHLVDILDVNFEEERPVLKGKLSKYFPHSSSKKPTDAVVYLKLDEKSLRYLSSEKPILFLD